MSAEDWIQRVDAIVEDYRAGKIARETAVDRLKPLGITVGDAARWLGKIRPQEG